MPGTVQIGVGIARSPSVAPMRDLRTGEFVAAKSLVQFIPGLANFFRILHLPSLLDRNLAVILHPQKPRPVG